MKRNEMKWNEMKHAIVLNESSIRACSKPERNKTQSPCNMEAAISVTGDISAAENVETKMKAAGI